ncbi:hypothetical protein H9P43_000231 [Blastocladiella emersonii ATCC 22665]|nr:hypothetical protein H9P43_000231 [Blastocladiella emersonii ATCC 22665]
MDDHHHSATGDGRGRRHQRPPVNMHRPRRRHLATIAAALLALVAITTDPAHALPQWSATRGGGPPHDMDPPQQPLANLCFPIPASAACPGLRGVPVHANFAHFLARTAFSPTPELGVSLTASPGPVPFAGELPSPDAVYAGGTGAGFDDAFAIAFHDHAPVLWEKAAGCAPVWPPALTSAPSSDIAPADRAMVLARNPTPLFFDTAMCALLAAFWAPICQPQSSPGILPGLCPATVVSLTASLDAMLAGNPACPRNGSAASPWVQAWMRAVASATPAAVVCVNGIDMEPNCRLPKSVACALDCPERTCPARLPTANGTTADGYPAASAQPSATAAAARQPSVMGGATDADSATGTSSAASRSLTSLTWTLVGVGVGAATLGLATVVLLTWRRRNSHHRHPARSPSTGGGNGGGGNPYPRRVRMSQRHHPSPRTSSLPRNRHRAHGSPPALVSTETGAGEVAMQPLAPTATPPETPPPQPADDGSGGSPRARRIHSRAYFHHHHVRGQSPLSRPPTTAEYDEDEDDDERERLQTRAVVSSAISGADDGYTAVIRLPGGQAVPAEVRNSAAPVTPVVESRQPAAAAPSSPSPRPFSWFPRRTTSRRPNSTSPPASPAVSPKRRPSTRVLVSPRLRHGDLHSGDESEARRPLTPHHASADPRAAATPSPLKRASKFISKCWRRVSGSMANDVGDAAVPQPAGEILAGAGAGAGSTTVAALALEYGRHSGAPPSATSSLAAGGRPSTAPALLTRSSPPDALLVASDPAAPPSWTPILGPDATASGGDDASSLINSSSVSSDESVVPEQYRPLVGTLHDATASFAPRLEDELGVARGDTLRIEWVWSDGWAWGINIKTGDQGAFPLSVFSDVASPISVGPPVLGILDDLDDVTDLHATHTRTTSVGIDDPDAEDARSFASSRSSSLRSPSLSSISIASSSASSFVSRSPSAGAIASIVNGGGVVVPPPRRCLSPTQRSPSIAPSALSTGSGGGPRSARSLDVLAAGHPPPPPPRSGSGSGSGSPLASPAAAPARLDSAADAAGDDDDASPLLHGPAPASPFLAAADPPPDVEVEEDEEDEEGADSTSVRSSASSDSVPLLDDHGHDHDHGHGEPAPASPFLAAAAPPRTDDVSTSARGPVSSDSAPLLTINPADDGGDAALEPAALVSYSPPSSDLSSSTSSSSSSSSSTFTVSLASVSASASAAAAAPAPATLLLDYTRLFSSHTAPPPMPTRPRRPSSAPAPPSALLAPLALPVLGPRPAPATVPRMARSESSGSDDGEVEWVLTLEDLASVSAAMAGGGVPPMRPLTPEAREVEGDGVIAASP